MKQFSLSLGLGFLVNNIVATMLAMFVLNPLLNPMFEGMIRKQEEGLEMPSLLSGYFLLTLFMVIGYRHFSLDAKWLKKGIIWGLLVGGIAFIAGHLIVAGWSSMPPLPMLISGVIDTVATLATGILIAYFHRNE
ncbi:MAG: hypothetical protein COA58_11645 [Bacteroidetes bacterium]|nr:MAG: hypothetical protein COA58_11645 [Bacteroidota bacterium]